MIKEKIIDFFFKHTHVQYRELSQESNFQKKKKIHYQDIPIMGAEI